MRFVIGPRQSGKTTLARDHLAEQKCAKLYYNFDQRDVRQLFKREHYFYRNDLLVRARRKQLPWACFDELHKMPRWKNTLKDFFDSDESRLRFIVTGSARLDLLRKAGDSLAGRYLLFTLYPLVLDEVTGRSRNFRDISRLDARTAIEERIEGGDFSQEALEQLLTYSGFPEPFASARSAFHRVWRNAYIDRVVREDLRDLTRIAELENVATLFELLPQRIGSPLSLNALREDLEVSYNAVRSYVRGLELGYVVFRVDPWSKSIARSIRKESKFYFYDYTRIAEAGTRFENYVALELRALVAHWTEAGMGDFHLSYVRTRDGKETDFIVIRNGEPWFLAEAKLKDEGIASHHLAHARALGGIPVVLLVAETGIAKEAPGSSFRISASRFF